MNTMTKYITFADLQYGEVFRDITQNILMKVDNLSNPEYNAVYLHNGLLTMFDDSEPVWRLNYEKGWYEK